jgi:transcriptional regulator GlxA family with amidase domain
MTTIGVLLHEGAEELDAVGPWEVFTASDEVRQRTGAPPDTVLSIAQHQGLVRLRKGLRVLPDATFETHPRLDVVVVPGGDTLDHLGDDVLLDWLRRVDETTIWTTSVCTGSFLLVESGIARGRRVATHQFMEDRLAERGDCTVVRNTRWVVDGKLVTSQGVSAGIDMALWVVGQLYGVGHARATQRYLQYDPAPPYPLDPAEKSV